MTPPRGVHLTGPEVAQVRRALVTVEHRADDLRRRGLDEQAAIVRQLEEAVETVRFLLERAEARRDVH